MLDDLAIYQKTYDLMHASIAAFFILAFMDGFVAAAVIIGYRTERYPPGTPFLESTTCQSSMFRARKEPAQARR